MSAPDWTASMPPADDEVSRLRVPPHSVEAEQSLLGAMLCDNAAFDKAADVVVEGDFYRHEHRLIFGAIALLVATCKPADVITVFERLEAAGKSSDAGGLTYLNQLAQSVTGVANARRYAEIVRERSILRRLIAASDDIATAAFNPQGRSVSTVLEEAAARMTELQLGTIRRQPKLLASLVAGRIDRIQALHDGAVTPGWPTGHAQLDDLLLGGLRPGKVYVLGARPSIGKSSFAQDIGLYLARQGLPVLMLSQEMPEDEVADRALASLGGIDSAALQTGKMQEAAWSKLTDAVEGASRIPFYVDDQPALRLSDIRAKARAVPGLKVLILDYLQLSAGSDDRRGDNRNTEIGEISRGLKALAKSLGVAVLELSQLNRSVELRASKRPQMSDLRESGDIEQDADVILFLWTARRYQGAQRIVGCAIEKHRGGPLGEVAFEFWPSSHSWRETDETLASAASTATGKGFE